MYEQLDTLKPHTVVLLLLVVWMVLLQVQKNTPSLILGIAVRWYRWFLFASLAAISCRDPALIDRPLPVLIILFSLVWFLLETVFNWLAVKAFSEGDFPLFPNFTANLSGPEWPVDRGLLKLKEQLKALQFTFVQSLKAEIASGLFLRMAVYQDAQNLTRLQVVFIPHPSGSIRSYISITSQAADGQRYVTDNLALPYGGFYPEEWHVERRPRVQKLKTLLAWHQRRLAGIANLQLQAFDLEPVAEVNRQQRQLERLNLDLGFIVPTSDQEELGKITQAGRYRVWVELMLLNYFGMSRRYR